MVTLGCTAETAACMIHETRCTPIYSVYCPREFVRQMLEALNSACPQHFIVPWMVHAFILPLNEVELPAVNKPFTCYWPKLIIKRRSIVSIENGGRIQSYGQNFRGDYSSLRISQVPQYLRTMSAPLSRQIESAATCFSCSC